MKTKKIYKKPDVEHKVIELEEAFATSQSVETTGTAGGSVTETWTDTDTSIDINL